MAKNTPAARDHLRKAYKLNVTATDLHPLERSKFADLQKMFPDLMKDSGQAAKAG
jgi:hypothetical protein